MQIKIDLHVHTIYSGDSTITPEKAVDTALQLGLDGIAITDHDNINVHEKILKNTDLLIIPGIEISSKDGHILGIGLLESIELGLTALETVEKIHQKGGIAVIPHPMNPIKHSLKKGVLKSINPDALEILNASTLPPFTLQYRNIEDYAKQKNIPQTGGSDAHIPSNIGKAYTLIETNKITIQNVISAIRNGKTAPQGSFISISDLFSRAWLKMENKIRKKI